MNKSTSHLTDAVLSDSAALDAIFSSPDFLSTDNSIVFDLITSLHLPDGSPRVLTPNATEKGSVSKSQRQAKSRVPWLGL